MVEKSKNKGPELGMTWTLQVRKKGNAFEALREGRVDEDGFMHFMSQALSEYPSIRGEDDKRKNLPHLVLHKTPQEL